MRSDLGAADPKRESGGNVAYSVDRTAGHASDRNLLSEMRGDLGAADPKRESGGNTTGCPYKNIRKERIPANVPL